LVNFIKSKYVFYNLYAAYAIRKGDLSICEGSPNQDKCMKRAEDLYDLSNAAKGRCASYSGVKGDFCIGLSRGCNAAESDVVEDMCNAIRSRNVNEVMRASYQPDWAFEFGSLDEEGAKVIVGVYQGFKTGKVSSCLSPLGGSSSRISQVMCNILFSPAFSASDFNRTINDLLEYYKEIERSAASAR